MPASNRQQILEGAIECVQTRGVANTTTRDIAAAANASLASIPYHFGSKDALMDEALAVAIRRFATHLGELAYEEDLPPLERLASSLETTAKAFAEVRPLLVSLMEAHVRGLHSEDFHVLVRSHRRFVAGRIAALVQELGIGEQGVLAEDDARALGVLVLAVIDGLMLAWLLDPEQTPTGEELAAAVQRGFEPLLALRQDAAA